LTIDQSKGGIIVEKVRYMISDAANIAGVESHVLRYWEDELALDIPRNEMGHRYYTKENIQQFQRIKELKEQGYQLKSIRMILHNEGADAASAAATAFASGSNAPAATAFASGTNAPAAATRNQPLAAGNECPAATHTSQPAPGLSSEDRMAQFRELMSEIVGRAIAQNNEELSQNIGTEVQERVLKEMNYLMREQENSAEERYKKLDAAIRGELKKRRPLFAKKDAESRKKIHPAEQGT
jgi:DNA-binding transcriptional MerR regulator